ncbi:unannotated protein [freshwater metagenome]|uniref:Unannotated protein n=1 Tax=freshwater metagenome TaxID=449393 RepID=A0A6J6BS08_9ZZZZ
MRKLLFGVLVKSEVVGVNAQIGVPVHPLLDPVVVPLFIGAWLHEKFHFHLLELASSEDEVSRCDFVSERLPNLANAKRRLHSRGAKNIGKVHKDTLRGFRTEVVQAFFGRDWAKKSL